MLAWLAIAAFAGPYEDGVSALGQGDAASARTHLQTAVAAEPKRVEAWWELGWAHWALGDWSAAGDAWDQVAVLEPTHGEVEPWRSAAQYKVRLADAPPAEPVATVAAGTGLRFVAAGDTMMGTELKKGPTGVSPDEGRPLFAATRQWFRAADIAFLNLEGPLADGLPDRKCSPTSTACYAFRTPTSHVAALTDAGIDVVSLANNHAMDLGAPGMASTMRVLDDAGIAHAGRYGDVARLEVGGVRVAVVAAHSGSCCLNVNDIEEVTRAIRLADRDADLVVFSFHGGAEGSKAQRVPGKVEVAWGERRGDVRKLSRAAVDAGADLVIGHGPHVLRAMEVYRGRLIAYSLGNYTGYRQFGTQGGPGGTSVVLDVELARNGVLVSGRLHSIALDDESVPHADPSGSGARKVGELSALDFPETGVRVGADGALSWTR